MRALFARFALVSASAAAPALLPCTAHAETDACSLLTPAQVSAVLGVAVGPGTHVTPTFFKTCTWTPTGSSDVRAVMVKAQTSSFYDGAKQKSTTMGLPMRSVSVGDDGFIETAGQTTTLWSKKGPAALKVKVYAKRSADVLQTLELALAKQAARRL